MKPVQILSARQAACLVGDGQTIAVNGFIGSCSPEALTTALEERFLESGAPSGLTLVFAAGQGNRDGTGTDHFAHRGLVRRVIGGHWNMSPNLGKMAIENEIEAYNFPQGVISHLFRDIAAGKPGTLSRIGMDTFVDPRKGGGKLNAATKEDMVQHVEVAGRDMLFYKAFPIDVCLIRGSYADECGNIVLTREVADLDATCLAQAVKNSGGKVIVQVEKVVGRGSLDARLVKIPGIYVDAVVVASAAQHVQCVGHDYDPSLTGEVLAPGQRMASGSLDAKKIIGRRAAMELVEDAVVNLGIGTPEYIARVAGEEGLLDSITLTVESGGVGGMPQGGSQFGATRNPVSILDQAAQFDFYDGGGLDLAFLGLAQADQRGSVNVSKFGSRLAGCGGFINITQNAKKVFFCGTFTASGLQTAVEDGKLNILQEGRTVKFLKEVEQETFSGPFALESRRPVTFITERAVFSLEPRGLVLTEIAPGVDIVRDILPHMEFAPIISENLKEMDAAIFREEPMRLSLGRKEGSGEEVCCSA